MTAQRPMHCDMYPARTAIPDRMNRRTAILAASFGTALPDAIARAIAPLEKDLALHTGLEVRRAFSSEAVRSRLMKAHGMQVPGIPAALESLRAEGFDSVIVQPLMLMPGGEYARLAESVRENAGRLHAVLGEALLRGEEDMDEILKALIKSCPLADDTLLAAMAHGSACDEGGLYAALARRMAGMERPAALCTIHDPASFEALASQLAMRPQRKVHILPFLLFPGAHARENLCGDSPASLRGILAAAGFEVTWTLRGLCELPEVRDIFVRRAQDALDRLASGT